MTTLYLIRHAEAEGNAYRRIDGWYTWIAIWKLPAIKNM